MGTKKKVWRDPVYGNKARRASQYWAARLKRLGPAYMLPTDAELAEAEKEYGLDSVERGRVRPADKNGSDLLVWGEDAVLAAVKVDAKLRVEEGSVLHARSLECRPSLLDLYFRKPEKVGKQ